MPRNRWNEADTARLRQMVADNVPGPEIARTLGRSRRSIGLKMSKLGLSFDPAVIRARSAARAKRMSTDADILARRKAACKRSWEDAPDRRAIASARARQQGHFRSVNGVPKPPQQVARMRVALKAFHARRLAWLPDDWRETYQRLVKRVGQDQAKRTILDRIAAKEAARIAAMTPFERQLEAVRKGAKVITRPVLRAPEYAYTLGGVASGQL